MVFSGICREKKINCNDLYSLIEILRKLQDKKVNLFLWYCVFFILLLPCFARVAEMVDAHG
jgi:hypothetical protein